MVGILSLALVPVFNLVMGRQLFYSQTLQTIPSTVDSHI